MIECLDWQAFIARYDTLDTPFCLDPPYYGNEDDYGRGLSSRDQFAAMASALGGIRGRFVLSLNDLPEVREIFAAFEFQAVDLSYRISGGVTAAREVIITARA